MELEINLAELGFIPASPFSGKWNLNASDDSEGALRG
jgi:hypothetical protein